MQLSEAEARGAAQWEGNTADQQVRVNLRLPGEAVSIKRFVWCGDQICEERDSRGGTVTKRFFAEGEERIGGSDTGNYYYTRDHLGSIREVTAGTGRLVAQYDYDSYGKSLVVDGNMNVDFGYTGHYFHAPSGLNLTLYRAYNPTLGRWLSRDPIGEAGGVNLYGYVENNPINLWDPLGLEDFVFALGIYTPTQAQIARRIRGGFLPSDTTAQSYRQDQRDDFPAFRRRIEAIRPQLAEVDTMQVVMIESRRELSELANSADLVFLMAHGSTAGEYRIGLGEERVRPRDLGRNVKTFGCNPSEGEKGAIHVRRIGVRVQILTENVRSG